MNIEKRKMLTILYYVIALCWLVTAIADYAASKAKVGEVSLAFAGIWLCIGAISTYKYKKICKKK